MALAEQRLRVVGTSCLVYGEGRALRHFGHGGLRSCETLRPAGDRLHTVRACRRMLLELARARLVIGLRLVSVFLRVPEATAVRFVPLIQSCDGVVLMVLRHFRRALIQDIAA